MGIGTVLCALVGLLFAYSGLYSWRRSQLTQRYIKMQKQGRLPLFILGDFWPHLYDNTDHTHVLGDAMKPSFIANGTDLIVFYTMSWKALHSKI